VKICLLGPADIASDVSRASLRHAVLLSGSAPDAQVKAIRQKIRRLEDTWAMLRGYRPRDERFTYN
jgi:hypothetical protein